LHARGLDAFRTQVAAAVPEASVDTLTSWDDVKILDVKVNRLHTWHKPGLLCIGDAAHAMSPVGGVGINLAVADAVAAAGILAKPLLAHLLTEEDVAAVQRRRRLPAVITQSVQRVMHVAMRRVIAGGQLPHIPDGVARAGAAALTRLPGLTVIPAYLVGVGVRPERAPQFARRAPR